MTNNQSSTALTPPAEILGIDRQQHPVVDHYAGSTKFLHKALELFPDHNLVDITIDLEDGAPVGGEQQRANELLTIAASAARPVGVRIHPLDSAFWIADLKTAFSVAAQQLTHITIPKVEEPALLKVAISYIQDLRRQFGVESTAHWRGVRILVETPRAITILPQLAAIEGLCGLDFGIMDYVSCYENAIPREAMRSPGQFQNPMILTAKQRITTVAHAFGLSAAHNVTLAAPDATLTAQDARDARALGFNRMWSIHPNQVHAILRGMAPNNEDIQLAQAVLAKAQAANWGPIEHGGLLYDRASYRYLWSVIKP